MPTSAPVITAIGVVTVSYTLAQKTSRTVKTTPVEPLIDQNCQFVLGATVAEDGEWRIDGLGDLPEALALGDGDSADPGINGMSGGKILCTSLTDGDNLKGWNHWSAAGEHCPDAS